MDSPVKKSHANTQSCSHFVYFICMILFFFGVTQSKCIELKPWELLLATLNNWSMHLIGESIIQLMLLLLFNCREVRIL